MAAQRPSRQSLVRAWLVVLLAWTPRLHAAATEDNSLADVCRYKFVAEREKLFIAGEVRECAVKTVGSVNSGRPEGQEVGDLVIVNIAPWGICYTWYDFSASEVLLELGRLEGCDGSTREAYRISPPRALCKVRTLSLMAVKLRAEVAENASLFWYEESRPGDGFETGAPELDALNGFVRTGKNAEDLAGPTVLVVMKQGEEEQLSNWPRIAATVEGAWLAGGDEFGGYSITGRRFTLSAQEEESFRPYHPKIDFNIGPPVVGLNSGDIRKRFYIVDRKDGLEGVVWRDQNTLHIFMTWLAADLRSSTTTRIPIGENDSNIVAIASDGQESLAILTFPFGINGNDDPYICTAPLLIHVVDSFTGAIVRSGQIPTQAFGIHNAGGAGPGGSMVWDVERNQLGAIFGTYRPRTPDGLHHQIAVMMTIDVASLAPEDVRHYWASGHSFGNSMVLASNGDFLAMDLGDNVPRGISARRFTREFSHSRLVYTFRATHAWQERGGSPVYEEISNENVTYYQWSNDNNCYSELAHAGIVEVDDGILCFFVGENPPLSPRPFLGSTRNPGFVKIPKDLTDPAVLSPGEVETGGFYNYHGQWAALENKGINFLTNYTLASESGSRMKTARLGRNKIALFWEVWSHEPTQGAFIKNNGQQWMVVDDDGQEVVAPFNPGYHPRLGMSDDLRIVGGRAVAYSGDKDGQLLRYEFCISDDCPTTAAPPPPPTPAGLTRGAAVEVTCGPGGLYHPARVLNVSADGVVVAYKLAGRTYYCTPEIWRLATGSNEDQCAPHGGILPSWGGLKCCPASCGVCGGDRCHAMPGGKEHCCTRHIPEHRACGQHGARAPCTLAPSLPQSPWRRL